MRTQVGIVGAGPAGLLLSLLLHRAGVDCVVLESRSRDYVESRVRAGVLEQGTVDLMDELGAGERLHREGMPDPRLDIRFHGGIIHIDLPELTPGQDGHDLWPAGGGEGSDRGAACRAAARSCSRPRRRASTASTASGRRSISRTRAASETLECDIVAGCDGFHGICRGAIPEHLLTIYDRDLSVRLARHSRRGEAVSGDELFEPRARLRAGQPPLAEAVAALRAMRAPTRMSTHWPDRRIWDELHTRLYDKAGGELDEGPILQKGVMPLRAYRRRADASRPPVPRRRRRPHRAADRRQGPQSRRRRRARAVARADRVLPHRRDRAARPLFRHLPEAGLEGACAIRTT